MDGNARLIAAAVVKSACLWCEAEFAPRKGGSPQRFCNSKCRDEFHSAGRRFAELAVLSGLLTAADLRNGPVEACTLFTGRGRRSDYPGIGYEETALSDAQRASLQKVQLELSIAADGILDLCRLGWLDPDTAQDPEAVGDAVADLTNAALLLHPRPNM
jgi:hypothetical protein